LKERYLVEKVFVSVCSNANDPISERDTKEIEELLGRLDVDGNTQGKSVSIISYLRISTISLFF
jgi:hypothetical protein